MSDNKKMVEAITPMDTDFAQWYTDVVVKAQLIDYSSVKGFIVYQPYGYAIWENIQGIFDARFKQTGHENVSMPLLIPESLLQKEKDHVDGFAPEVAWVTHGGSEPLAERMCIRPTSETLFCEYYQRVVQSWRDLPKLYNQWCSVVRWEKTTRPFLRGREFLWQEGHTIHATEDEARSETLNILDIYADVCEKMLAIPVIKGRKTESDKFAGAQETYCIEAMMHDGKALQAGTSHYFGDGFARAFDIQYTDKDNKIAYPHQTSWGVSTRLIGGIIMTHGDDNGLVLPPAVAPIQVAVIPVAAHKPGVTEAARAVAERLREAGLRVKVDETDNSPGWKFAEYEMKGVPVRLEIGPKDIENGQCVLVTRDTREKSFVPLAELEQAARDLLDGVQARLYQAALTNRETHTYDAANYDELKAVADMPGFVRAMWCGSEACEDRVKEETGLASRCIPFERKNLSDKCVCCGQPAAHMLYWGKAY